MTTTTATITAADEMGSSDMNFAVIVLTPNELPIADAGPDQTVDDLDEDGTESITLDGSGSSDSDAASCDDSDSDAAWRDTWAELEMKPD